MNKMLIVLFDHEAAADAGLQALRQLHAQGDITLYASGVLARSAEGVLHLVKPLEPGLSGATTGLAVGSLIGLLGGPAGVAVGALTGTVAGAVRDFWTVGVGLDFIEATALHLLPGKVALVAEVEEEWVIPVDTALQAAGGHVFRRTRTEVAEAHFDHDIVAFKSEIRELQSEASHAHGLAKTQLQSRLGSAKAGLDGAVQRAKLRVEALKQEAHAKADSLTRQAAQTEGAVKTRLEDRIRRVRSSYLARGAKLAHAWSLAKEALAV
jgi:uncharacterized membrane protein